MNSSFLQEPAPQKQVLPFDSSSIEQTKCMILERPWDNQRADLFEVLAQRRTRREFAELTSAELSQILWHTAKVRQVVKVEGMPPLQFGQLPSAGGCRAIEVLVIQSDDSGAHISRYDGVGHSLQMFPNSIPIDYLKSEVCALVDPGRGTVLVFAADRAKLEGRYTNCESLAWRDSGVLIAGLALVAEAMGFSCCPLGFTGQNLVSYALDAERYFGVGGCILGGKKGLHHPATN